MAFRFVVLLAVFATISAASRENYDFIDYYDCSGKADGNYLHNYDCTRYITCLNGDAADMACADCDQNNVDQCTGYDYLIYDQTANGCLWPIDTTCQVETTTTT